MARNNDPTKTYWSSVYEINNKWLQSTNFCKRMDTDQYSNVQGHRNIGNRFDRFQITGKLTLENQMALNTKFGTADQD